MTAEENRPSLFEKAGAMRTKSAFWGLRIYHDVVTVEPLERPADDKQLLAMLDMMDAEHILMFASDYPHWDFDSPEFYGLG
jgi:predicted TIM-barrel fold metal-dependent hydrolase